MRSIVCEWLKKKEKKKEKNTSMRLSIVMPRRGGTLLKKIGCEKKYLSPRSPMDGAKDARSFLKDPFNKRPLDIVDIQLFLIKRVNE